VTPDLLSNIRDVSYHLDVRCNTGTRRTPHINTVADLQGYGTFEFEQEGSKLFYLP
jgi:hypothetical protein